MKKISRASWLIIGNVTILFATITLAVRQFPPYEATTSSEQERRSVATAPTPPRQTSTVDVEQSPLFHRSRKPLPEMSAASTENATVVSEPPILIGIVGEVGRLRALMEGPPNGERKLLDKGDVFMGWSIISIQSKTVKLQAYGNDVVLNLNAPRPILDRGAIPDSAIK